MRPDIPQYRHQQLDVLARMFGEAEPLPAATGEPAAHPPLLEGIELRSIRVISGPTFTPTPGRLDETRKAGQLFWLSHHLPHEQQLGWHRNADEGNPKTLYVQVAHHALDGSRRPRTPESCAALRQDIAKYGDMLGVYSLTIDRAPEQWTFETIKDLAFVMDALLPDDQCDAKKKRFCVSAYGGRDAGMSVHWYGDGGGDVGQFIARIQFFGVPPTIVIEWCRTFGWWHGILHDEPPRHTDHQLDAIDNLTATRVEQRQPPPPAINADDDLDEIEKASRRALHGQKAIPQTSQTRPADNRQAEDIRTVVEAATSLDPEGLEILASWAKVLLGREL